MKAIVTDPDTGRAHQVEILRRGECSALVRWLDASSGYGDEHGESLVPLDWFGPRRDAEAIRRQIRTREGSGPTPTYLRVLELRREGVDPAGIRERLQINERQYYAAISHASRRRLL